VLVGYGHGRRDLDEAASVQVLDEERAVGRGLEAHLPAARGHVGIGTAGAGYEPLVGPVGPHAPDLLDFGSEVEADVHESRPIGGERRIALADVRVRRDDR
jgi:hypothetical protein